MTNYKLLINNKEKKYYTKKSTVRGFTILETLVAVLILSLVLNSVFALISSSLFGAKYAKNEMIASYLSQEVVDSIRNKRDTNMQSGSASSWNDFLDYYDPSLAASMGGGASTYCSDPTYFSSNPDCSSVGGPIPIYYDSTDTPSSGYYTTQNIPGKTVLTVFKRSVKLTMLSPDELDITITISWINGSTPRTRTLHNTLTNWQ